MARFERGVGVRQRIKQFLLIVALCLMPAVLIPSPAFTKIDQKVLDSAEQGAKKNISTITNLNEATLQNHIDQFEASGKTKMADDLKSRQIIWEDVGDVTAMDDTVARKMDDDNILVIVKARCGDHEAVAHFGYQISSGNTTELNSSKVETLEEKSESVGLNLIIGMGTIFAVSIFIALLVSRFKYIHDWMSRKGVIEKEEREYKEKVAAIQRTPKSVKNISKRINAEQVKVVQVPGDTKVQCISALGEIAVEGESVPAETVAVLAAAVAVNEESQLGSQVLAVSTATAPVAKGEDPGPDGLIIKSLRRRGNSKRRRH